MTHSRPRSRRSQFFRRRPIWIEALEPRHLLATVVVSSSDVPKPIPATGTSGVMSSVIPVAVAGTINDVNVTLNLTHTFDGDLEILLIGPVTVAVLSANRGGSGDNYTNTTFDDEAATAIAAGSAPFSGTFRPETPLAGFDSANSAATWTLQISDEVGGDSGTLLSWSITFDLTDVPVVTVAEESTYVENADPKVVSPTATLEHPTVTTYNGGSLSVSLASGAAPDDALSIRNQGTGTGQIGLFGSIVTYSGVQIGTASGGTAGSPLVVDLNANASAGAVQDLLRNITFEAPGDNPSVEDRSVTFVVDDGVGGVSFPDSTLVHVIPVNDPPVLGAFTPNITYVENAPPLVIDNNVTVADADSANFAGGNLRVRFIRNAQAGDRLAIRNSGNISTVGNQVRFAGVTFGTISATANNLLEVQFNASATAGKAQALLRNVTFEHLGNNPLARARTVRAQVVDGDGGPSNAVTKLISVTPVNDAPRLLPLIGGTVAYVRGAAAVGLLPGAVVNDPDSPNFAGGKLVVRATAGFHASNRLLIAGGFTLVGNQVRLNGTTIGLRNTNGGIGFTKLEITFNGNATREIVEQLVRGIRFRTAGPSPTTQRVFELFVTDGDGGSSNKVSKIVNVS